MAKERKMTPARFLKRNMPYFVIAVIVLLLVGAVLMIVRQVKTLGPAQQSPTQSEQTAKTDTPPDAPDAPDASAEGETANNAPAENVYQPPFDGTIVLLASNQLIAVYDESTLSYTADAKLSSFVPLDAAQTARIDVQDLGTSRKLLKSDELMRICKGVLQAYYYAAPATEDIAAEVVSDTDEEYRVMLTAAAYGGAPEVSAEVWLYELSGTLWCVSAVYPEGETCDALRQTMDAITVRTADMKIEGVQ